MCSSDACSLCCVAVLGWRTDRVGVLPPRIRLSATRTTILLSYQTEESVAVASAAHGIAEARPPAIVRATASSGSGPSAPVALSSLGRSMGFGSLRLDGRGRVGARSSTCSPSIQTAPFDAPRRPIAVGSLRPPPRTARRPSIHSVHSVFVLRHLPKPRAFEDVPRSSADPGAIGRGVFVPSPCSSHVSSFHT